jgi:hypothetical protein
MPTSGSIQSPRVVATGSIASATSLSNTIDLMGYRPAAIDISSGWDAANRMTFRVSGDGATFYDLYDSGGSEYQIASGAIASATGRSLVPLTDLALALLSHRYVKIQSGPSSAPANLTTGISFAVQLVPM